jgi:hypothetical protein
MGSPSGSLSPLAPFSAEQELIDFATDGVWTADDLASALKAFDEVYSAFLLARHLAVLSNERGRQIAESQEMLLHRLELEGPHLDMLFHEWRRMWRRLGPGAASLAFPFSLFAGIANQESAEKTTVGELDYCLANPGEYLPASRELVVHRIAMASPGGFSLRGLGEPLKELRELVKDLWFRNRQERERGDLEIAKMKIALLTEMNLAPHAVQVLAVMVCDGIKELEPLVESGKLSLPNEGPPKIRLEKPKRRRTPRRKPTNGEGGS